MYLAFGAILPIVAYFSYFLFGGLRSICLFASTVYHDTNINISFYKVRCTVVITTVKFYDRKVNSA